MSHQTEIDAALAARAAEKAKAAFFRVAKMRSETSEWLKRAEETQYGRIRAPLAERFWNQVQKECQDKCWAWIGRYRKGRYGPPYGDFCALNKHRLAHRVAYELSIGPIPDGMCVCHRCDNPSCCNPQHLFLGTHSDNMRDRNAKGRTSPPLSLKGTLHPMAKITAAQVAEIRAMDGTQAAIAQQYGISQNHVCAIRKGKYWASQPIELARSATEQLLFEAKSRAHELNQRNYISQAAFDEEMIAECRRLCRGDELKARLLASVALDDSDEDEMEQLMEATKPDPRDPDPSRPGIFRDHNCAYCDDGKLPCRQGSPNRCEYPHARND